jgi:CheY-like chemotaxis protein
MEHQTGSPDRVLVVDDDDDAAWALGRLLQCQLGCKVRVCGDGRQAVDAVCDFRPQVVLMDIRMPGIDGMEAAALIGRLFAPDTRPRVIAMTAIDNIEPLRAETGSSFDAWLRKPLSLRELIAALTAPQAAGRACPQR